MKKYFVLAIMPLFFSGTIAKGRMPELKVCNCTDSADTIPAIVRDTIISVTDSVVAYKIDSFRTKNLRVIDSINQVSDSLELVIKGMKKSRKRFVVMMIEEFPPLNVYPHMGLIWWGRIVNGDTLFTHTEEVIIKF